MLILLPPSEGKAEPARRGRPVRLDDLGHPELTSARATVLDALVRLSSSDGAAEVLGVGPSLLPEVRRNARLVTLPARPALEVYTGVLYAALDPGTLSPTGRRRAGRSLRVQSALWGLIGPSDRIPPYRLSMATTLPGLGPLAGFWRVALAEAEQAGADLAPPGVVVDCRSSSYAAAWRPGRDRAGDRARDTVAVRVLTDVNGRLQVVSHAAKHTRGLVARALLEAPNLARTPQQVAAIVARQHRCSLEPERSGWRLDVVTDSSAGSGFGVAAG